MKPRIPPLSLAEADPATRELLARLHPVRGSDTTVLNVMGTLAQHPELFRRWLGFATYLLNDSTLEPRLRELVVLRAGWRCRSPYEWGQHVHVGRRAGVTDFERVYLHPGHHAGYYPGASPIHLKLLFSVPDGRILGAQAIGLEGVEKRIDVIATAIQFRGTVHDLAEAELCYAPQFGAAKDPVNLAGMLAENVLNGDMPVADWLALDRTDAVLVDVREPDEFAGGHMPNAINLPLSQMRDRYAELPTHREIWTCCGVGQRAYFATRFLLQHGYRSRNLSGGYTTYQAFNAVGRNP